MQLPSSTNQSPTTLAVLLLVTLAPLYYASYRYRFPHSYGGVQTLSDESLTPSDFIREWLDVQLISPFNPSPLATYCSGNDWYPNLVFNLDNANGGIGNVRGNILDFIFFAIEAGASIILPGMAARDQQDLSNVFSSRAQFDTFFDEEWFMSTMATACPQMAIYKPESHHELADPLPGNYLPHTRRLDEDEANTKKAYLEHLDAWLKEKPEFHPGNLTLVSLERTLWDIDTRSLPQGFRRNFGHLVRINPAVRRLSALVVQKLASQYARPLDPSDAIPPKSFYGAHLRTEYDAVKAGWLADSYSNFSAQTDAYIASALKHNLHVMYVASGNSTDLDRFRDKAAAHRPPLNVTSKFDLLPEKEATALRELSWDQQALVDYEVLQRCSVFGGITKSSFSYNIALTRNERLVDLGTVMDPWYVMHEEDGVGFDDGVSRMLGRDDFHERRIPKGMWP